MCAKTCRISNLFCMICLVSDLAGGQPITPYNNFIMPQLQPQQSLFFGGSERIHPTVHGPPSPNAGAFFQPNFYAPQQQQGYGGAEHANPMFAARQQQMNGRMMMLQQEQQRLQNSGYRGGFGGFAPPTFGAAPIHPQPSFASPIHPALTLGAPQQPPNAHNFPSNAALLNGRTNFRPDIPTELVVGRQMPLAAKERQQSAHAFGSPLLGTEGSAADAQQQQLNLLQSVNAVERTSTINEATFAPPSSSPAASSNSELPRFLQGAPAEAIDAFKRIIREPNLKYDDQVKRINEMVSQKLDPEHQELYKEFMRENDEREEKHRERIHNVVAKMTPKAQEQFAKISAVLRGPGALDSERWERVLNLYARMEPTLRDEFESHFKDFGTLQNVF